VPVGDVAPTSPAHQDLRPHRPGPVEDHHGRANTPSPREDRGAKAGGPGPHDCDQATLVAG
jgi:hypothetical protein